MQPRSLQDVIDQIGEAFQGGKLETVDQLLWEALNQHDQNPVLWHFAGLYFNLIGNHAVAGECVKRCHQLEGNPGTLVNLGKTYRHQQKTGAAVQVLQRAERLTPDDADMLGALAASYVGEGNPVPGIEYGERSLLLEDDPGNRFNLALLHLEAMHFRRGFELYATGQHKFRGARNYAAPGETEPPNLTPAIHDDLLKLRDVRPTLLVYGEQGIGDEIMFSTVLKDASKDYRIIFDCHPRLEALHRTANWVSDDSIIMPNRKIHNEENLRGSVKASVDAKCSIGNLCRIYRNDLVSFQNAWTGYPLFSRGSLAEEAIRYREHLLKVAGKRRIVGLAMRGGTFATSTTHRRLNQEAMTELMGRDEYFYVGFDYEDMLQTARWISSEFGPGRYMWPSAINFAWDYHHVAALILATDVLVSVPQSVAHLSAALIHPTIVLNPIQTAWRETGGDTWYWYGPHAKMLRMREPKKWPMSDLFSTLENMK